MTAPQIKSLLLDARLPRLEVRMLLEHVLNKPRAWLLAHDTDALAPEVAAAYEALAQRRLAGEPMAYLLGHREFMGHRFRVTPDVLIPRPDTEVLVETALVASNDDMAIGAIRQLHENGVATPGAVSVIGFDDVAIAPYIVPSLSSVRIPVTEMIQETISRMIFMLDGGEFKPQQTFSGELILRDSVIDGPHR